MPEYLSPGVYVEETSFRSKSIEGVSTTTTGFVGPCRFGPVDLESDIITSLAEFERVYGDGGDLVHGGAPRLNYLWHAVRAFFAEGGARLYVARTPTDAVHAIYSIGNTTTRFEVRARYPGAYGNLRVRIQLQRGQNILVAGPAIQGALADGDIVEVVARGNVVAHAGHYRVARHSVTGAWTFSAPNRSPELSALSPGDYSMHVVTLTVSVAPPGDPTREEVWTGLTPDAARSTGGQPLGITRRLGLDEANPASGRNIPIVVRAWNDATTPPTPLTSGLDVLAAWSGATEFVLSGGDDGRVPDVADYEGSVDPLTDRRTGLRQFESREDISIVAAPGATAGASPDRALAISQTLITHCQRMRYRIAVLDAIDNQSIADVRALRARMDSSYGALYYPWIRVIDPHTRQSIHLPPSGFVAGIYARNDRERAVYKAPANEVVGLAVGLEKQLSKGQQDLLNPEGVNCFRFFEGRGYRLWGARTVSSDPEWKYVNLRRYFAYLERSIDRGTQWAVFEPNGEALWGNVRRTIEDFLFNEFQSGALLGDKPDKAYFVKCDRSTMTQNDLDNGRLVCLIGVAPLRPAEFVIFRIGQWTGDRKV